MTELLSSFDGREVELDQLRDAFETTVWCSVSSDSSQGGFWLSSDVTRRLGRLGLPFACTVYVDDPA